MPNLTLGGNINSSVNGANYSVSSIVSLQTSSSTYLGGAEPVTSSAWTNITFGGFPNLLGIYLQNDATIYSASVISVASASNGAGVFAILPPGAAAVIPWSGSYNGNNGVYAEVVGGWPIGTPTPQAGQLKWQVQSF